MKRVTNRHGVELLVNQDLVTIVEPMRGEADIVVLHFGRDVKAIVRGTLEEFMRTPGHRFARAEGGSAWCCCGFSTNGWANEQAAQAQLDHHIWDQEG